MLNGMEAELTHLWNADYDTRIAEATHAHLKKKKIWAVAYVLREQEIPRMIDYDFKILTRLAFLTSFPMFSSIVTTKALCKLPQDFRNFYYIVSDVAKYCDNYPLNDLATDDDWNEWIDSM